MTSSAMIDEPVVTVSVTLGCASKVTRRFVAFIDPPSTELATAETIVPFALAPQRIDSQVAPLLAIVEGERETRTAPRASARSSGPRRSREPAPDSAPARVAGSPVPGASSGPAPRRTQAGHARRRSQAGEGRSAPSARPVAAGVRPQPCTGAGCCARGRRCRVGRDCRRVGSRRRGEVGCRRQQRLTALEENVAALRAQSAGTAQALAALQLRLKTAESDVTRTRWCTRSAALSALLALAVALLWWRQSHSRAGAQWWLHRQRHRQEVTQAEEVIAPDEAAVTPEPVVAPVVTAADVQRVYRAEVNEGNETATRPAPFMTTAIVAPSADEPRELSVEELIDLEQQAEFFVVLGQGRRCDRAADEPRAQRRRHQPAPY